MKSVLLIVLTLSMLALTGCKSPSGAREFIPGKGWVPLKGK